MPDMSYLILGAGKQGVAAAYDAIKFGAARRVVLADGAAAAARAGVQKLEKLLGPLLSPQKTILKSAVFDARKKSALGALMKGHQALLSAVPYYLNPVIAEAAIAARVNYCDLGGYFEMTQKLQKLDGKAKKAGVSLIPDCGVSPGLCNSLAVAAMEALSTTESVKMYCGGLPQKPKPPLNYKIVFNLEGVIGNYFGKTYILRDGKIEFAPAFADYELVDTGGPLGKLEAVMTGGATSTCPWTFEGKIKTFEYKTFRYPGHFEKFQLLKDLGLLEESPLQVNGYKVSPRDVFVKAAGPRLAFPDDRDWLIMRVHAQGQKDGRPTEVIFDLLDAYDEATGFTAMQRTTGFSAAIVLEALARGEVRQKGAAPLETALSGRTVLEEIRKRGIQVKETVREWKQ
jgi:lysine 6-dehydrogenase